MKLIIIIPLSIFIIIFALLAAGIYLPYGNNEVVVDIPEGTTASGIAQILYQNEIIRNKTLFLVYTKLADCEKKLSYGEFHFPGHQSMKKVIWKLENSKVKLYPVTIIEGLTIKQTASVFSDAGFADFDRFVSLCYDSLFAKELAGLNIQSLEGLLYPDTYRLPKNISEEYIINSMVNKLINQLSTLDLPFIHKFKQKGKQVASSENINTIVNTKGLTYDLYNYIVLASIVEREATFSDEKPLIAGVYHNRLRINKRLQADPTVAYALREEGIVRQRIYYNDLKIDSPYNTYRYHGLPPTPICSPSILSIKAAIQPQETEYFFFFANNRGRHIFTKTYQDHLRRQREMRN